MNRLLIIDGNAVLHRAFHALPQWRNRQGEATSGVYGFFSMLLKTRQELGPEFLAVTFDLPEPNFRHGMYVGYQSNRGRDEQLDADIWGQVDKLKLILERLNIPVFQVPGFEADDVIGTLVTKILNSKSEDPNELEVVILTGDRDLLQLVDTGVKVYLLVKGVSEAVLLDREGVRDKMGVWPEQIIDLKALTGDASDGYPGVLGIGPKTAVELLEKYSDLDSIYNLVTGSGNGDFDTKQINSRIVVKLAQGYEMAKLSQSLATIVRDVPLTANFENANMPAEDKFAEVFEELGYRSLVTRLVGKTKKGQKVQNKKRKEPVNLQQESLF